MVSLRAFKGKPISRGGVEVAAEFADGIELVGLYHAVLNDGVVDENIDHVEQNQGAAGGLVGNR